MARVDVYQKVTDAVIAAIENGKDVPWRKPWVGGGQMPTNLVSKRPYRGVNLFLLSFAPFNSPYWMTYKQAQQLGGQVRKGEKSHFVVYFNFIDRPDPETGEIKKIPFLRWSNVFNADQVDGIEEKLPKPVEAVNEFQPIERCEAIVAAYDHPPIINGNGRAFYRPPTDEIGMPAKESFATPEGYYATLFHEMGHSTGHPSRLNRKGVAKVNVFGSNDYSKEELIAEMAAAMLCGETGISPEVIENQAAYLANWLKKLKSDKKLLVQAASKAQKAVDLILGREAPNYDEDRQEAAQSEETLLEV